MQSRTSYFNKAILKKNILHFWPVWVLYTLFLMSMPLFIWIQTSPAAGASGREAREIAENNLWHYVDILNTYMCAVWVFAAALICAMVVFYYMYSPKSAYMVHSLPVNRKQLYLTNYVSGLLFLAVPQCLTFLVTAFVCFGRNISRLEYLLYWLLMVMGMGLFAYSLAVLLGLLTGQFYVVPIFFFIANYLYMGVRLMIQMLIDIITFGVSHSLVVKNSIFSPLHWLIRNAEIYLNEDNDIMMSGGKMVAVYAAAGIGLAVLAWLIYQRRHLETVGDFITMKWLKPVFRWGSAVCFAILTVTIVSWIFRYNLRVRCMPAVLLIMAIFAVIFFFAAQMLLEKQFKVINKSRIKESICLAALLVVFVTALDMDVFGMEKKVPDTKDIKAAYLYMDYPIEGDQKEEIERIRKLHQEIIQSKKELEQCFYQNKNTDFSSLTIRYYEKDRSVVDRVYDIPIMEEYRKNKGSILNQVLEQESKYENQMEYLFGKNYEMTEPMSISLVLCDESVKTEEEFVEVMVEPEYVEEFYQAMQKDMKEGNLKVDEYNEIWGSKYSVRMQIQYYNTQGIDGIMDRWNRGEQDRWIGDWKSSNTGIEFNEDCKHLMKVLEKSGMLDGKYKLPENME